MDQAFGMAAEAGSCVFLGVTTPGYRPYWPIVSRIRSALRPSFGRVEKFQIGFREIPRAFFCPPLRRRFAPNREFEASICCVLQGIARRVIPTALNLDLCPISGSN